jgi:hypothetical protein
VIDLVEERLRLAISLIQNAAKFNQHDAFYLALVARKSNDVPIKGADEECRMDKGEYDPDAF